MNSSLPVSLFVLGITIIALKNLISNKQTIITPKNLIGNDHNEKSSTRAEFKLTSVKLLTPREKLQTFNTNFR